METKPTPMPAIDPALLGALPTTGYLANTFVPTQLPGRKYNKNEGLMRGTLFPGLDLPFQNRVNTREVANTPSGEIMALDFAIHELGLYLDVHPNDSEALELFNTYVKLSDEAKKSYQATNGPLTMATPMGSTYSWTEGPWPWEKSASSSPANASK